MAAENSTRFAHLLQPIRDLSKVWKIEIADELERYIEEVAELIVTNPTDGLTKLNFAEAALLIQGSTAIYSRKVELLYQLVYQALDLLALDKKDSAGKKAKATQSGLWSPIPETEELLTIDHLIKEGRNIFLDHGAPEQRQAMQRRVPLFLMPRDQADRRKKEFRISSCTVHRTGVYLLQESDARLLDDLMMTDEALQGSACMDGPLVPAPPREVQDLDDRLQELLRDLPDENAKPEEAEDKGGADEEEEGQVVKQAQTPAKQDAKTPMKKDGAEGVEEKKALPAIADPWAPLDEHANLGQDVPLEVGKTSKRLNTKKFTSLDGLPDAGVCAALEDEALWGVDAKAGLQPMLSSGNPVDSVFLAVAGTSKPGGRYETQKAGFSAAWLEFEDLFAQAMGKRRTQKMTLKAPQPAAAAGEVSDDEASGNEAEASKVIGATPMKGGPPPEMDSAMMPPPLTEEQLRQEEQRKEVAMLENMIQDAQHKYESTIRQHLASMQKDSLDGDNKRFPQLYANVKRWEEQLAPVLKEFESRPDFNIHDYSTKFLAKLADLYKDGDKEKVIPFSRLVHGQPRYEICRRFLTCLFLTNIGNTDIVYETEEERLNKFGVKLLKAEKKWISLEEEEEKDAQAQAAPSRGKKSAAAAAPGEDSQDAAEGEAPQGKRRQAKKAKAA
mmetsp:Transcript_41086/g.118723  ORF Transcript_41086/g.118723 Transcript_41086/m.118723 type:complete len:671 (+) Transcript_41086:93-2105(+)